jgi:hypothetical protein
LQAVLERLGFALPLRLPRLAQLAWWITRRLAKGFET